MKHSAVYDNVLLRAKVNKLSEGWQEHFKMEKEWVAFYNALLDAAFEDGFCWVCKKQMSQHDANCLLHGAICRRNMEIGQCQRKDYEMGNTMHETITAIREALQMTKTQLAAALECSPAQVTRLEDGTRTPNRAIMARLWALCPQELRQRLADEVLRAAGVPVNYVRPAICPDCGYRIVAVTKDGAGDRCRECPKCGARFVEEVAQ